MTDTTHAPDFTNCAHCDGQYYPCGCLRNTRGAHRGDGSASGPCPDYETVYPAGGSTRLDDLTWKRRDGR